MPQWYFWNSGEEDGKWHSGTFGTQGKRIGRGTVVLLELRGMCHNITFGTLMLRFLAAPAQQ
jgi:hypothetical protein